MFFIFKSKKLGYVWQLFFKTIFCFSKQKTWKTRLTTKKLFCVFYYTTQKKYFKNTFKNIKNMLKTF